MLRVLIFAIFSFFIMSCDKDEPDNSESILTEPIISLEVGNYWIFQNYIENEDGVFQADNIDSMYVELGDIVNGQQSFIVYGYSLGNGFQVFRDSSGYLINLHGEIEYSPNNNEGVLFEKIYNTFNGENIYAAFEMSPEEEIIETPSGTFNARAFIGRFDYSESTVDCEEEYRTYYSKNIGQIRAEGFLFSDCRRMYRELIRYSIQE